MKTLWRRAVPIGAAVTGLLGLVIGVGASPSSAAPQPQFTTFASGFDNPRGLTVGRDGVLYVAEAGRGGAKADCIPNAGPDGGDLCPGLTSAISVINPNGSHHRIVSGLASFSGDGGFGAVGVDGISFNEDRGLYGIITSCPQQASQLPPGFDPKLKEELKEQAGQEIKVTSPDHFRTIAPVGRVDWQFTVDNPNAAPPGNFPDCNPYGILAQERGQWVVDAAANTLDHVVNGKVDIEKYIPNLSPQSDAVPTCVAQGPDGALYLSELTGGASGPGAANVYRFDPKRDDLDVWASGLTAVTGCGFGPDGHFYATEFSTTGGGGQGGPFQGAVVMVPPHSHKPIVVASGLSFPNGFAASGDAIYVSNWSISISNPPPGPKSPKPGEVVKIVVHGDDD